jgi:hypothetical protein
MNTSEAAGALDKSVRWVREACASGQLEASLFGGTYSITDEALARFRASRIVKPAQPKGRRRPRRAA